MSNNKKSLLLGAFYSVSISLVIYFVGNLIFFDWISFVFFLTISIAPSIIAFILFRKLDTEKSNLIIVKYSVLLGFFVSFLSLLSSLFMDDIFNEQIYWSLSHLDLEDFKWFLSFAVIGSILFIPISYLFLKINNKLTD